MEKDEKCTKVLVTRLKPKKHLRSMNNTVTIPHQLSNFSVTEEPKRVVTRNVQITVTSRKMKTEILRACPPCGGIMHIHKNKIEHLQHLSILQRAHILLRTRCEHCGYTTGQQIPFKVFNHRITKPLPSTYHMVSHTHRSVTNLTYSPIDSKRYRQASTKKNVPFT